MVIDPLLPVIFGLAAPIFWMAFFLYEDREHPEPKWMLLMVFLGGILAAFLALGPEIYLTANFPQIGEPYQSKLLIPFAFVEEFSKFAVVFLLIKYNKHFDEKVDAMIYMITAALGFAAIENIFNIYSILEFHTILETTIIRGVGATLLHALASGILAFHWAKHSLLLGLINASILHASFNYLILRIDGDAKVYSTLILVVAALFLFRDFEIVKQPKEKLIRPRI